MKEQNLIVGVSGGKDSTATCLHLQELGYKNNEYERVFLDTGWEDESTYQYLDYLETKIGKIKRLKANITIKKHHKDIEYFEKKLGYESPMIRLMFQYKNFPRSFIRWCTRKLKIEPLKKYYDTLDFDPINVVGIRKEESVARSRLEEYDWSDYLDCEVWRPLINWKEHQVIKIHKKHQVNPNPLYLQGSDRVGCYPCINSNKKEIRKLTKERIQLIHEIEVRINRIRKEKGKEVSGFFKTTNRNKTSIHDVVDWSRTARGGTQYLLFDTIEPSCVKWGMCEFRSEK